MPDLDWNMGFPADAEGFIQRFENGGAFVAHMRGVNAAGLRGDTGQRDQFLSLGVRRWRILKSGGNANGSVTHPRGNQLLHTGELAWRRGAIAIADHDAAYLSGAHVTGEVDADPLLFQAREI